SYALGRAGVHDEPTGRGKSLQKCGAATRKAGATFVAKTLAGLGRCVGGMFTCLQLKPADAECPTRAQASCDAQFARIAAEADKLGHAIDKGCAALPFGT